MSSTVRGMPLYYDRQRWKKSRQSGIPPILLRSASVSVRIPCSVRRRRCPGFAVSWTTSAYDHENWRPGVVQSSTRRIIGPKESYRKVQWILCQHFCIFVFFRDVHVTSWNTPSDCNTCAHSQMCVEKGTMSVCLCADCAFWSWIKNWLSWSIRFSLWLQVQKRMFTTYILQEKEILILFF